MKAIEKSLNVEAIAVIRSQYSQTTRAKSKKAGARLRLHQPLATPL